MRKNLTLGDPNADHSYTITVHGDRELVEIMGELTAIVKRRFSEYQERASPTPGVKRKPCGCGK